MSKEVRKQQEELYQEFYNLSRKNFLYPYPKKKNDISSESRYRFNV